MRLIWIGITGLLLLTGCGFRQTVVRTVTNYRMPLPRRCTPAKEFHLSSKDHELISAYISERNRMEWLVDIRSHGVCLIEVIGHNHLGLIKINSIYSSHWENDYFINGSKGVSLVKWGGNTTTVTTNVKEALAEHQGDFSADEISQIQRYFGE